MAYLPYSKTKIKIRFFLIFSKSSYNVKSQSLPSPRSYLLFAKKNVVKILLVLERLHSLNIFASGKIFGSWTFWLIVLEPNIMLFIEIQIMPPKKQQKVGSKECKKICIIKFSSSNEENFVNLFQAADKDKKIWKD